MLLDSHIIVPNRLVLLHLDSHVDYVTWFWSVLAAGGVPVVSTPLSTNPSAKTSHLEHVQQLLHNPKVLTTAKLKIELQDVDSLDVTTLEELVSGQANGNGAEATRPGPLNVLDPAVAFMMLTSGSTGNAKAVEGRHDAVVAAVQGKLACFGTGEDDVFLNWIGKLLRLVFRPF